MCKRRIVAQDLLSTHLSYPLFLRQCPLAVVPNCAEDAQMTLQDALVVFEILREGVMADCRSVHGRSCRGGAGLRGRFGGSAGEAKPVSEG
jgi:hypothetical protein